MKTKILNNLDACIISSKVNRQYLCNYTTSNGMLIITKKNDYFLTDFRYIEEAEKCLGTLGYIIIDYKQEELKEALNKILKNENVKSVGIEDEVLYPSYQKLAQSLQGFNIKNISKDINELRCVKTEEEIKLIKHAQSINDKALEKVKSIIKAGITERDLSIELKYQLLKHGADEFAFEPIVAFGVDTSKPHCMISDKKLESGDVIMLDFGAKYKGYCCDMTRMLCLGKPAQEIINAHNLVLKAQNAALSLIKDGIAAKEVDFVVREIFTANGCAENFGHGLGHGVGLDIHELPNLKKDSEDILKKNMLVTVEPGLYFKDKFGVRIEDLVVITENGIENLAKSDKELIIK